ncbi:hypothetical protein [Arthrobacter sp. NicSoilC12]|uniref:hypothetical protein n=1 Tax=Arthrobacter sp. NicSoilC12 TaxID=2831001 RepID=UPI001CC57F8C|nr:hypothetical protein [Arthrobacter sp. NicSoilC12]
MVRFRSCQWLHLCCDGGGRRQGPDGHSHGDQVWLLLRSPGVGPHSGGATWHLWTRTGPVGHCISVSVSDGKRYADGYRFADGYRVADGYRYADGYRFAVRVADGYRYADGYRFAAGYRFAVRVAAGYRFAVRFAAGYRFAVRVAAGYRFAVRVADGYRFAVRVADGGQFISVGYRHRYRVADGNRHGVADYLPDAHSGSVPVPGEPCCKHPSGVGRQGKCRTAGLGSGSVARHSVRFGPRHGPRLSRR